MEKRPTWVHLVILNLKLKVSSTDLQLLHSQLIYTCYTRKHTISKRNVQISDQNLKQIFLESNSPKIFRNRSFNRSTYICFKNCAVGLACEQVHHLRVFLLAHLISIRQQFSPPLAFRLPLLLPQ